MKTGTIERLEKALRARLKGSASASELHELLTRIDCAAMHVRNRVDYHTAVALRVDNWLPACNGLEEAFDSRSGKRMLYCWNPATGEHAYLDCRTDMILTNEEAQAALMINSA